MEVILFFAGAFLGFGFAVATVTHWTGPRGREALADLGAMFLAAPVVGWIILPAVGLWRALGLLAVIMGDLALIAREWFERGLAAFRRWREKEDPLRWDPYRQRWIPPDPWWRRAWNEAASWLLSVAVIGGALAGMITLAVIMLVAVGFVLTAVVVMGYGLATGWTPGATRAPAAVVMAATRTPMWGPTDTPTSTPTETPTDTPTSTPTETPTNAPTDTPTRVPTVTRVPTRWPTSVWDPENPCGLSFRRTDDGEPVGPVEAKVCTGDSVASIVEQRLYGGWAPEWVTHQVVWCVIQENGLAFYSQERNGILMPFAWVHPGDILVIPPKCQLAYGE